MPALVAGAAGAGASREQPPARTLTSRRVAAATPDDGRSMSSSCTCLSLRMFVLQTRIPRDPPDRNCFTARQFAAVGSAYPSIGRGECCACLRSSRANSSVAGHHFQLIENARGPGISRGRSGSGWVPATTPAAQPRHRGHAQLSCSLAHPQAKGRQHIVPRGRAGMGGLCISLMGTSVVILVIDEFRVAVLECEGPQIVVQAADLSDVVVD